MKIGDVYIVNSKLKNLETVKVKKIKEDQVIVEVLEGTPAFIGDTIVLSKSTSDFASFVYNDYIPTFFDKAKKVINKILGFFDFTIIIIAIGIIAVYFGIK